MNYPWLPVNKLPFTEAEQKTVKLDGVVERGTSPDLQSKYEGDQSSCLCSVTSFISSSSCAIRSPLDEPSSAMVKVDDDSGSGEGSCRGHRA
jgi:hypothetical protein